MRHRRIRVQGCALRHRPGACRPRFRYIRTSLGGRRMGRRYDERRRLLRQTHQYGACAAVCRAYEGGAVRRCAVRVAVCRIPDIPIRLAGTLRRRASLRGSCGRLGICHVHGGRAGQLLSDISAYVPLSGNLSGKRRYREHDLARLLHVDAGGHVSGVGHRVRDTRRGVAIR